MKAALVLRSVSVLVWAAIATLYPLRAQLKPDLVWMRGSSESDYRYPGNTVAVTPDQKVLVTGTEPFWYSSQTRMSPGGLQFWRTSDGMLLRSQWQEFEPSGIVITPDSRLAIATYDRALGVYDVANGRLLRTIPISLTTQGRPISLVLSPDGQTVAVGTLDGFVRLINIASGTQIRSWQAQIYSIDALTWSTDGTLIATANGQTEHVIRIWNPVTSSLVCQAGLPETAVRLAMRFRNNDTQLIAAAKTEGASLQVTCIESHTGVPLLNFNYSWGGISSNAGLSPDGMQIVAQWGNWGGYFGLIRLNPDTQTFATGPNYEGSSSRHVHVLPDGSVWDSFTRHFDPQLRQLGSVALPGRLTGEAIHLSAKGQLLAGGVPSTFILGAETGALQGQIPTSYNRLAHNAGFSPAGLLAYSFLRESDNQWRAYVYRLSDMHETSSFATGSVRTTAPLPNGSGIATIQGQMVRLLTWTGEEIANVPGTWSVSFSPDGRLMATRQGDNVLIYSTLDWTLFRNILVPVGPDVYNMGSPLVFSPDSKKMYQGFRYAYSDTFWTYGFDIVTGAIVDRIPQISIAMDISPDGHFLALGNMDLNDNDPGLFIYFIDDGSLQIVYRDEVSHSRINYPHYLGVRSIKYSADGKYIYYGRQDGAVCCMLNPFRNAVVPSKGGNTGQVTVKVVTSNDFVIVDGAEMRLTATGLPEIVGHDTVKLNEHTVQTTFDLRGAPIGPRDLKIELPGGASRTYPDGFTVEEGIEPALTLELLGRARVRGGAPNRITLIATNTGNTDLTNAVVWVAIPADASFEPEPGSEPDTNFLDENGQRVVRFFIGGSGAGDAGGGGLGAGASKSIRGTIRRGLEGAYCIWFSKDTSFENKLRMMSRSFGRIRFKPEVDVSGSYNDAMERLVAFASGYVGTIEVTSGREGPHSENSQHFDGTAFDLSRRRPDGTHDLELENYIRGASNLWEGTVGMPSGNTFWELPQGRFTLEKNDPETGASRPPSKWHWHVELPRRNRLDGMNGGTGGAGDQDCSEVTVSNAVDPNDIQGPQGYGANRWVSGLNPMGYLVMYENMPTASAPAAEVTVTTHIDPTVFDLTTFQLGDIKLPDNLVTPGPESSPPVGAREFHQDIDLRPSENLILRIEVGLDLLTGEVKWHFISLDPDTMELVEDPDRGYLGIGEEGSCLFSVMPKTGLLTGTTTSAVAEIVFDYENPIRTPVWVNTLDYLPPATSVLALPGQQNSSTFLVKWMGKDSGAGLKDFTIYVSDNGGDYTEWLMETTKREALFTGSSGHTYRFYSVGRDNTNNIEPAPTVPDATTTAGGTVIAPLSFQVTSGIALGGNLSDLLTSEDRYVMIGGDDMNPTGQIIIESKFGDDYAVSTLRLTTETAASRFDMMEQTEFFNYDSSAWEVVGSRVVTLADATNAVSVSTNPRRFMSPDGNVKARITWQSFDEQDLTFWHERIDFAKWELNP